jgi:CheY-like chemotaxis protein
MTAPATRPRVLIVDDQPLVAMMLAEMLNRCAAGPVDVVHTREAAAALLAGSGPGYQLAFIDLKLGDTLGGVELVHQATALGVKVVAITGYSELPGALEGVALLTKPFSFQAVQLVFEAVLKS